MAKLRAIKTSFNGGEISKQLFGRVDLESFIASNKQMKNVLPTIYGSAMNRGGTVFVNDNIKHFFKTLQEVTGVTNINCIGIDWGNNKYILGCDSGYIAFCDFDFATVDIKQITYDGNAIGDITSVAAVGENKPFAPRYCVGTETAGYWFTRNRESITSVNLLSSSKTEVYGLKHTYPNGIENENSVVVVRDDQISAAGIFKYVQRLQIYQNDTWYVIFNCKIGESGLSDFDVFPLTDERYVKCVAVCDGSLTFGAESPTSVRLELGVAGGTVIGAKSGTDNSIEVYIYKQVDGKYYICCNIYNSSGELVKENTIASFSSDYGINKAIFIDNEILFIGSTKSVCLYKNSVIDSELTGTCLSYVIKDNKIFFCDGGNNINVIENYNYSNVNTKRVLVPFRVNKLINYVIEFGNNIIRFYKDRKLVVDSSNNPYEIPSPYGITDLIDSEGKLKISYVQNVDVLYICNKDFPIQALKRYGDNDWVLEDFTLVGGPFNDVNVDKNKTLVSTQTEGLITVNAVNNASSLSMNNDFTEIANIYIDNSNWKGNLTVWQLAGNTIYQSWSFLSIEQAVAALLGTVDGANFIVTYSGNTINVTVKTSAGSTYNGQTLLLRRFQKQQYATTKTYTVKIYESSAAFSASSTPVSVFTENDVGKLIRLEYVDTNTVMWETGKSITNGAIRKSGNNYYKAVSSGTTGQIKPTHTDGSVSDGGVTWLYLHSGYGVGTILEYVSASQIKVNADGYFPNFTYGTYLWELGVIGDGVYPNCCAFYKERFIFSISTNRGTKICASCAGDYNNFSDNSFGDILPENAITVLLQGNQESLVLWMTAINKLYIGTACEEFIFGEQTIAEVLSPTNVMCVRVSSLGSAAIMPLHILDELFFVSNNEKQIANFTYIAERDSFRPMNISVMFEHLLHNGVKCWAYTKEPYKTIWFSDKDGNLRSISYDADNKVCAGARHDIGGKIISLAVIPEPNGNYDELWMVVERVIDNKNVYYTERLSWGLPQEDVTDDYKNKHQVFSDCAKVVEYDENTSEVGGLYFLEGKTVKVVVDGVIQEDKVVSDGAITLDKPGKVIVVGLGYDWLVETLFINIGANDGTAQALPQRVAKLMARCINTRYLTSKATGGNRYDVVCNSDVLVDNDFEIHLPSDYSRQMTIFFAGDKPVSCCILAIVAEMKTYQ